MCEEVPPPTHTPHTTHTWEGSLVYMRFAPLSLENKLFGVHHLFLPVEALEFSELKTP